MKMFFISDNASCRSVVLYICCLLAAVIGIAHASNGNAIKFAPLPQGTPYKLRPADNKGYNGLVNIVYGIASILRDQPPYGNNRLNEYSLKAIINVSLVDVFY